MHCYQYYLNLPVYVGGFLTVFSVGLDYSSLQFKCLLCSQRLTPALLWPGLSWSCILFSHLRHRDQLFVLCGFHSMGSYYDQLSIFGLYHAKDLSRKALTRLIEVNIIVFGKGNWF